ncbi:hypothetical protein K502DRAFT_228707 [Neoconidiobolus thromboides FSU 785]|nr:hypothetical protein K502DRAFT_228707 [Neoconidiobolus thromboides FSU 785]
MGYESLNKEKRRACWEVRDQYFKCLDSIQWIDADTDQSATCQKYKLLFSEKCPASWVSFELYKSYTFYK